MRSDLGHQRLLETAAKRIFDLKKVFYTRKANSPKARTLIILIILDRAALYLLPGL